MQEAIELYANFYLEWEGADHRSEPFRAARFAFWEALAPKLATIATEMSIDVGNVGQHVNHAFNLWLGAQVDLAEVA